MQLPRPPLLSCILQQLALAMHAKAEGSPQAATDNGYKMRKPGWPNDYSIPPVLLCSRHQQDRGLGFPDLHAAGAYTALAITEMPGVLQFAAIFSSCCLVSAAIGATGITRLVKTLGRPSIVIILMAIVLSAATVLTGISKGGKGIHDLIKGHNIGVKPFCG